MSKDTLQKQIEAWIEDVKYESGERGYFLGFNPPDDSFGWGELLQTSLNYPVSRLQRTPGLLLTGPSGCGKHTAADHALYYLTAERGGWADARSEDKPFTSVYLSGEDVEFAHMADDFPGVNLVYEHLNALLDAYEGQRLCFVLEYPERSSHCKELLRQLGKFSCMYAIRSEEEGFAPLFVIVITEQQKLIPRQLRERLTECRMAMPQYEQRLRFFTRHSERVEQAMLNSILQPENGYEELAEMTEGMTYAQLRDLTENLSALANCGAYDRDAVLSLAQSQLPEEEYAETKHRMFQKINQLIDALPELMERLPASSAMQDMPQQKDNHSAEEKREQRSVSGKLPSDLEKITGVNGKADRKKVQEQSDKMTTRQISYELFGEEETRKMLEQAEQYAAQRLTQ